MQSFFQNLSDWLCEQGLLKTVGSGQLSSDKKRYVLNDEAFRYTQKIEVYQCSKCHVKTSVPSYLKDSYVGAHCQQRFCEGVYTKKNKDIVTDYFKHYFNLDGIRINAHEHTGSLDNKIKHVIENEFKKDNTETPFHDVNFLSCTPTMEMGIDIGNLSSVILKSVPRNAASFVQRIGRSGRTTGNSLDILVIEKNPHNLYFWDDPKALLNWDVTPPACRYLTEHILQRQFNAYCLDQFLHDGKDEYEKKMPTSFSWVEIDDPKASKYWTDFYKFFKDSKVNLFQDFSTLFGLTDQMSAYQELKKYIDEDGPVKSFKSIFETIKSEIKFISQTTEQLASEIVQTVGKDSSFLQALDEEVENLQKDATIEVLSDFDESIQDNILDLHARIKSLNRKKATLLDSRKSNPLAIFADEGILPGYAFPEQGTELELNIRKPLENKQITSAPYHTISVSRPAEMALRELAPFNTFYTHGYKATVDRLGIYGNKAPFRQMGYCPSCSNVTNSICCENCGQDIELHDAYELKKAICSTNFQKSYVSDSNEKRDKERYEITRSFLFDKHDKKISKKTISYFNKKSRFGYEFQTNVDIISANQGHYRINDNVEIFEVCENCGAVRDRSQERSRQENNMPTIKHYKSCLDKNPKMKEVTLFREISSDAVRIPCPHPAFAPNLESILSLATRLHLRGDVGHIRIDSYDQPQFENNSFVVLFDNVPGGTGHLRDLFGISLDLNSDHRASPKKFISIFSSVLDHLEECPCEDGCYKCLWGTHNSFHRDSISKRTAIAWLKSITTQSDSDYQRLENTLFDIAKEHAFDGQTEVLFFNCLTSLSKKITHGSYSFQIKNAHTDELDVSRWKISRGDKYLTLESSPTRIVELKNCSIPYTKPDFTLYNQSNEPVAYIYTDGAKYHINPGEEATTLETDITIRTHISKEMKIPVITLTYSDLAAIWGIIQEDDLNNPEALSISPNFFDDLSNDLSSLKHELASQQLKIILRLFNILLDEEKEISQVEVVSSYQPWLMRLNTKYISMNVQERSLEISLDKDLRTQEDDYGFYIPDDYYAAWIKYWAAFNYANLSSILRNQIKFAYKD